MARPNFGVKLMRPGFGPAAELPTFSPASRRHGSCRSPFGSSNVIGGNRRAAQASARGTGRTAYTKDVRHTRRSSYESGPSKEAEAHFCGPGATTGYSCS